MSTADLELAFYERFFLAHDLEPYPVQEEAVSKIFAGESLLVTVPTGTGKTLMAKAALYQALESGKTAIYTTPLRALTEEKYRELCEDFGEDNVGFATGDYKENREAPIQVEVAEILWNRIYGSRETMPAATIVMDEGHYFNEPERGHIWEQSIIGLDPRTQLVILSATVGTPQQFCQWVSVCRQVPMGLVTSTHRMVPLSHEYRESYMIDVVRELHKAGDTPVIVFSFSRDQCFERARLLQSCPRFTSDEERARAEEIIEPTLLAGGLAKQLRSLLLHGIGVHHAGVLPRYKRLVEQLALERLIKVVLSTETIAAGINLPAKRVMFPALRKYIRKQARILTSAEYHQMAGRAGRPQFDTEGIAIVLAPEEVVQETRKEIKQAKKRGRSVDEEKIRKQVYARARGEAKRRDDVTWDAEDHQRLINGQPAGLSSRTRITAEQILAIGLPDLQTDDADSDLPVFMRLNIRTVIDHLLLGDREKREAQQQVDRITNNLLAMKIIDEHGLQIAGDVLRDLVGVDGLFVYFCVREIDFSYEQARELVELLVDHDVIHRALSRKDREKRRQWILARVRELRRDNPQANFEDAEQDYQREFPITFSEMETLHHRFVADLPHPELHGGKIQKTVWTDMQEQGIAFMDFVERHGLEREEGSLFSYLARLMKTARLIFDATQVAVFDELQVHVRDCLAVVDDRVR